jgi:4-cresol dehydrogenase (hydroxylating)
VSEADFAEALRLFAAAIGPQWVFADDEDLVTYNDAYSPSWGEPDDKVAAAALAPASVEQVQAIVRIANRFSVPLYPISTGRNLAYGGSAPVHSGSVILDLIRMNRILEVSEENAYALVEPGVSYFDLYRYLRDNKLPLWIDCPDPGWGSLIGNALDHGAGRTPLPYRDHFDAHCGMEVVLADGQLVRTGMGALPSAKTWQQFQYGAGPFVDGIFSQSNYGVVTKMGFWLMPEPEASMSARIRVPRHDDVIPFVRILANLTYSNLLNCNFMVTSPVFLGPPDPDKAALLDKPDGGSAGEWDRYAASKGLHFWETEVRFYGPPKVMAAQWEHVKERFAVIRGVQFSEGDVIRFPLTDEEIAKVDDIGPLGIPSLNVFTSLSMGMRTESAPTTGHLDASPIVPMSGQALLEANRVFAKLFREAGMNRSLGFAITYHWRSFIMFQGMQLSHDRAHNARVRDMYRRIVQTAAEHGWGIYRTHIGFMDDVAATYSFNDHALLRLHETLKDALDPNGILSAGRYGIWPKQLRRSRA